MNSFTDLGITKKIAQVLAENGFTEPTEIQKKAIPILLEGKKDFIGLAQTGTGKTAAFGIPLLQRINAQHQQVQALVLSPTRELGQQIASQFMLFSKYIIPRVSIQAVYGGVPLSAQIRALKRAPQIVVATPGRLIDLLERKSLHLSHITHVILDEADEMLNMGFQPAIDQILSFIKNPKSIWLFSATMPREIQRLVHQYMSPDYVQVKATPKNEVNTNIDHQFMVCPEDAKQGALQVFLNADSSKRSIVFCRTKAATQKLAYKLTKNGILTDALHGDLSQSKRDRVMKRFKDHQFQVLVATDVAARGIDVKDLHYVIHYNLPEQSEYYTHRSGRTARAGKQGISLCMVTQQEVKKIRNIARDLSLQFTQIPAPERAMLVKSGLME